MKEKYRVIFLNERKRLIDNMNAQSDSLDKYLLTLSAGTFTLTATFLKDIFKNIVENTILLIGVSWALMTLTILLTLSSFFVSHIAHKKQIDIVEKYYEKETKPLEKNLWGDWIGRLTVAAGLSFTAGLIFLFIFVILNLK